GGRRVLGDCDKRGRGATVRQPAWGKSDVTGYCGGGGSSGHPACATRWGCPYPCERRYKQIGGLASAHRIDPRAVESRWKPGGTGWGASWVRRQSDRTGKPELQRRKRSL